MWKVFYINDPNNKGWELTNNCSWLYATPGGADTAFNLQEGLDSIFTPCETVTADSTITGSGSTLVILCVNENTTGAERSYTLNLTSAGTTSKINVIQNLFNDGEIYKNKQQSFIFKIAQSKYNELLNATEGSEIGIIAGAIYFVEDGNVGRIYVDKSAMVKQISPIQ